MVMLRLDPRYRSLRWLAGCAAGLGVAALAAAPSSCHLVGGIEDRELGSAAGGAGAGTTGGGGTGAGTTGGGGTGAGTTGGGGTGGVGGQVNRHVWSRQFGEPNIHETATSVAVGSQDRIVLGGRHEDSIDFGTGYELANVDGDGVFVASFYDTGETLWASAIGAEAKQNSVVLVDVWPSGNRVFVAATLAGEVDPGGCALAGQIGHHAAVVALDDETGACLSARAYGAADAVQAHDLSVDDNGNVSVVGVFDSNFGMNPGSCDPVGADGVAPEDIFVASLDSELNCLWTASFAVGNDAPPLDLSLVGTARDGTGTYVAGSFFNEVLIGVDTVSGDANSRDGFVVKIDNEGAPGWHAVFSGANADHASEVALEPDAVWVAGTFSSSTLTVFDGSGVPSQLDHSSPELDTDIFLVKFDANGDYLWGASFGGIGDQHIAGLAVDQLGAAVLVGHFRGVVDFGGGSFEAQGVGDLFLAKLDSSGSHRWSYQFGGDGRHTGLDGLVNGRDEVVLAGVFTRQLDLGGEDVLEAGLSPDAFLAKFRP